MILDHNQKKKYLPGSTTVRLPVNGYVWLSLKSVKFYL